MPSTTVFIVTGLIVLALMAGLVRFSTSTKAFKAQPPEDQARARKSLKIALMLTPVTLVGTYLLLGAPPGVVKWMPVAAYLCVWLLAFWLLWRAYGLGIRRNVKLAKGLTGKPLPDPEAVMGQLAALNLGIALCLMAILVAIPVFKIPLQNWAVLAAIPSFIHTMVMQRIEKRSAG